MKSLELWGWLVVVHGLMICSITSDSLSLFEELAWDMWALSSLF